MAAELNRVVTELVVDASGTVSGVAQYVREMRKAQTEADTLSDRNAKLGQSGNAAIAGLGSSIAKTRSAYESLSARTDPIFAAQLRHQKDMERAILVTDAAVRRGVASEQQAAATISRLRDQQIRDLKRVRDAAQDVVRVQRAANDNLNTANIAAQFQDIAVTSAMGMSPLQIALQQGTQLSAAFGSSGAAGAVKALGAAFVSILSPISLVTIGLVAGTAALIQYFSTGEKESKVLDAALEAHGETIRALREAYGEAASGLQEYVAVSKTVAQAQAVIDASRLEAELKKSTDALVSSGTIIESEAQRIQGQIQELMRAFEMEGDAGKRLEIDKQITALFQQLDGADTVARAAASGFEPLSLALNEFAESVRAGVPDYIKLKEAVSEQLLLDPTNEQLRALAQRLFEIIDPGLKVQSAMQSTAEGIKLAGIEARSSAIDVTEFGNAIRELAGIAVPALTDMEKAEEAFRKGMAGALDANDARAVLEAYRAAIARIQNEIDGANVPIPTPRPSDMEAWGEFGKTIDETAAKIDQFKSRADGILAKMFPGEAARREAHELLGLLDKFGGKLDDFQRKAVEGRVDELFLAASLGMRDLGNETDKTGNKFGELKEKAQSVGDALKEGFSSFLQDLFTGRDALESIVQLGSRFASMNFDALVEGVSGYFGGGTQSSTGRFPAAPAKAVGKIIGTEIVDVVKAAVDPWSGMRATSDGIGSYTSARAVGQTMAQGVNPVLSKALNPIGVEISKAAAELGVSARDLGTLISYETKGTFSTKIMGGHGGNYLGLIQFGPEERQKYGAYWGQAFGDQMQAAVRYFKDRGLQPGMGIRDLYSTILTGSPGNYNRTDGYGTVDEHLTRMAAHQAKADAVLAGLPEAVKAGSTAGTRIGGREGIKSGVQEIGSAATGAPGGKASGFDAFAGLFGAALGGFSTGFQSGNVGMGVLGGGLQGLGAGMQLASLFPAMGMALPVIGAVVGGVAGLVGAIMGAKKKLKQAQDALQDNMKAIDALLAIGEGRGVGRIQKRLTDYLGEIDKAVDLAWKAKNMDLVKRLQESFNLYWAREARDFETGFQGMIRAYKSGRGEDDSYLQGQRAMEDLREEVRGLIADVRYFGEQRIALSPNLSDDMRALLEQRLSDELAAVTEASKRMVLAMIAGTEEMSEMERNVQSLQGAADAAQVVLEELGMSARAAAEAIDKQLNAAMAKLAAQYVEDVSRSIYDLADLGVFNDLLDAQQRYNDRLRDAAALGISADLANRELALSLRSIVKEANLTDDQIRQLAAALPMLSGGLLGLLGLSEGGDTAKALADAQAKVEEAKASLRSAYEKERSELDSTISRLKSFTDSIRTFKDSLKLDKELSPLDARERLAEAQRQFEEVSAQAMGTGPGAEAAQGRLEEVSRAYLEEARAYYGSNEMYYAIWKQVDATLDAALAKAGTQLSTAELQLAQLKAQVGALIDVDDSVKSVEDAIAELKKAQDAETAAKAADDAYKNALFAEMVELLKAQLAADEAAKAAAAAAATVSTATYSSSDPVANLYRSVLGREPDAAGYAFYSGNLNAGITSLASIEAELRRQAGSIGMAAGGMVNGGVPGTDSVLRMLMPGEFVMPAAATRRHEGDLWAMRSGQYGASNDNGVVTAIQRLTDQVRDLERSNADLLARLTAVTATGFSQTVSATNRTGDAMEQQGREQALQSRKRQAA